MSTPRTRVAFVYPNPRRGLLDAVAQGAAPDTNLLGQNHLAELGLEAIVYDSVLRRRAFSGPLHTLTWYGRELTLPFELRDADVICTPLSTLLPVAARVRRRPRVVVISYHLASAHARAGTARRKLLRLAAASADHIVCSSVAGTSEVVARLGLDESRASTVTLGVDERYWSVLPPASNGFVLTVGRDLARDYATFSRALAGLDVRGVIVAKEENLRGVEVPPNVDVRLNASPEEVRELYAGAACVVVPVVDESRGTGTENSGTVALLEAMATGRPVVASERRFLADYIEPGGTALTAPPEDPIALRDRIRAVLETPELGTRLGASARRRVEERHTTRHFAAGLARVIGQVDRSPRD